MYGKILRRERLKHQLTQVEIGEKIGRSKQWVSELECGNIRLNVDVAVALASILDVAVDVFFPHKSKKNGKVV